VTPLTSCHDLSKSFSGRPLFSDISLSIAPGDQIGLIGINGTGKTTLLKILGGLELPDSGRVAVQKGRRLVYLPQEDQLDPARTLWESALAALADHDIDEVERATRVKRALGRAGLSEHHQQVSALSGGARKRLALACALVQEPDLLLLDEPTNHLDLEGILWLQGLLAQAPFAFVLVTHDRYFLEQSCNAIVELSRRHPDGYLRVAGSYSDFLEQREARLAEQAQQEATLSNKVRREIDWLRHGPKARTTKSRARIDEAGRLMDQLQEAQQRSAQDKKVKIHFDATGRKTKKLLWASGLRHGFDDRLLFDAVELKLSPGVRIGLVGGNGVGKSTLLQILAGALTPQAGEISLAQDVKVISFEQDRSSLDPEQSLRRALAPAGDTVIFRGGDIHVVGWAARFLFKPEQLEMPVGSLSGGEQARILIARMMVQPADVLLLDEPTNDLDIASLEVLEAGLLDFPGAMVLVTHDRFLLDRVCTGVLGLDGEGGALHCADVSQWLRQLDDGRKARKAPSKKPRQKSPRPVRLTFNEQRELAQLEEQIPAAEAQLQACQDKVQLPEVTSNPMRLRDVVAELEQAQQEMDRMYARWEELETKREQQG